MTPEQTLSLRRAIVSAIVEGAFAEAKYPFNWEFRHQLATLVRNTAGAAFDATVKQLEQNAPPVEMPRGAHVRTELYNAAMTFTRLLDSGASIEKQIDASVRLGKAAENYAALGLDNRPG